jgi:hypothetical protein
LDLAKHDVVDALLVAQLEERFAFAGDEGEPEAGVLVVVSDHRVTVGAIGRQHLPPLLDLCAHVGAPRPDRYPTAGRRARSEETRNGGGRPVRPHSSQTPWRCVMRRNW